MPALKIHIMLPDKSTPSHGGASVAEYEAVDLQENASNGHGYAVAVEGAAPRAELLLFAATAVPDRSLTELLARSSAGEAVFSSEKCAPPASDRSCPLRLRMPRRYMHTCMPD